MRRVATLCARAGSKGVPGKNLRTLAGRPLLQWSLELALESDLFACVVVDTDSPELLDLAVRLGAHHAVERPAELADDAAGKLGAIKHAVEVAERLEQVEFDVIVDLDLTSPLRTNSDLHGAVQLLEDGGAGNVITGCESRRSPYFNLVELTPTGAVAPAKIHTSAVVRRQDAPKCYDMNASIYVWWRDRFMSNPYVFDDGTRLFEMPVERSFDIDEPLDFELVEWLMQKRIEGP